MRLKLILLLISILCVRIYLKYVKITPSLPGYHTFYYTPKKYKLIVDKVQENQSNEKLIENFEKLMPFWSGTMWSFSGKTEMPGEGSIACGYFVTTVLRDLGVNLNRNRLAQLPSEGMIRDLVSEKSIQRFNKVPIHNFVKDVKKSGKGLYVVGLDTHTGFILFDDRGVWFIHASGSFPFCVVKQKASEANILMKSKYRVLGKLSDDKQFIEKYIGQ